MAVLLGVLGVGTYVVFALSASADEVRTDRQLAQVADPLLQLCQQDPTIRARVGGACDTAAQAVSEAPERGADGRAGAAGEDGTPGVAGQDGRPGVAGRDGIDGVSVTGAPGIPGVAGRDGQDGDPGVPGPAGPTGPQGETGPPGAAGSDGAAGRNAELPTSYTKNFSDGTSETCTRAGGEDTAPVYDCTRS